MQMYFSQMLFVNYMLRLQSADQADMFVPAHMPLSSISAASGHRYPPAFCLNWKTDMSVGIFFKSCLMTWFFDHVCS